MRNTMMVLATALALSACGTGAGPAAGETTTPAKAQAAPAPATPAARPAPEVKAPKKPAAPEVKKEPKKKAERCLMCPKPPSESSADLSAPLGSKKNPVRCFMPGGEREYLGRLRCPDGKAPSFGRVGSFGSGPYGTIIDGYRVQCDGMKDRMVFMDMYHKDHVELKPVPGFKIDNSP